MMSHTALLATAANVPTHKQVEWTYMRLKWTELLLAALGGITRR